MNSPRLILKPDHLAALNLVVTLINTYRHLSTPIDTCMQFVAEGTFSMRFGPFRIDVFLRLLVGLPVDRHDAVWSVAGSSRLLRCPATCTWDAPAIFPKRAT
ncbi:hypothetical protein HNR39_003911 [Glaciimonas immobilis]|uniref:Uncharacterized protein n=1 Tax=Glaciimonas immobilis TaxID=728004 RepID=A0A840RY61_9BURK|nr:hypothetical protein [Glaciimonas immobilis]